MRADHPIANLAARLPACFVLAVALAAAASAAPKPCNTCEDLCQLVDEYLQKDKQIELYQQYAGPQPKKLPRAGESAQDAVYREFGEWLGTRELPCVVPLEAQIENAIAEAGRRWRGDPVPELPTLETHSKDPSCKVTFGKDELGSGDTQQRYEELINCKPISDAAIEHEKLHQSQCQTEYAKDPARAAAILVEPSFSAQNEVLAHQRHKELIEAAIRDIVNSRGCGWQPTERQRGDPRSVPSLKQMQDMNRRATKAARLLNTLSAPGFRY
jgi:hypothetical protein